MPKRITRYLLKSLSILLLVAGIVGIATSLTANKQAPKKIVPSDTAALLEIKGAIGPAVADYLERGMHTAVKRGDRLVILRIDTPGGLSKSMRNIIKVILASPIPIISYVAPSGARAASAGTYILYASHVAAMAPGTNLGAATPVSIASPSKKKDKKGEKQKSASQLKAINDAQAYIRSLAQLRGRNVKWAERAVSHAESLSAAEALKKNVINLIASNVTDLLQKINGMKVSVRGQTEILNTKKLVVNSIKPDWRSKFLSVITDPSVAYILLMIGFYGLFFEFANPGFILPGVAGAICLLLSLYAFQLLPINYAGLGLMLLGLAFIVGEAFMPSFGALGIGGVISFAIGSIMLMKTDVAGFNLPLQLIFSVVGVTILVSLSIIFLALRSRSRPVVSGREAMIGKVGVIEFGQGHLWVKVNGELWKIINPDGFHEGQRVEVTGIQGLALQLAPVEE